jgi:hypothetical protein
MKTTLLALGIGLLVSVLPNPKASAPRIHHLRHWLHVSR